MSRPVRLTAKQKEIMGLILMEAGKGCFLSQQDIHARISYGSGVTFGAIRVSIRFLRKAGMVVLEKRSAGLIKDVKPTNKGYDWFRPQRD